MSKCKYAICIIGQPGLNEAQRRIRITWGDRREMKAAQRQNTADRSKI